MNVLYIAGINKGGSPQALLNFLAEIKGDSDIKPIVLMGKNDVYENSLNELGIENYKLSFCEVNCPRSVAKWKRFLEFCGYPLVILVYYYRLFLSLKEVKKCVNFNEIDLIHTNDDRVDFGAVLARKYHKKHIWHLREHLTGHFKLYSKRLFLMKYMNNNANQFIAISNSVADNWIENGLNSKKIQVVYDGLTLQDIPKHVDRNDGINKIVFVGQIYEAKGQKFFLETFSKLPRAIRESFSIDFYGSAEAGDLQELESIIKERSIKNVTFHGNISEVARELYKYDIGVNCSAMEGLGRTTIEYLAAGLITIAHNTGGSKEILLNKELLYNDEDDLISILTKIYEHSIKIENNIQDAEYYKEKYNIALYSQRIMEVYKKL